MSEVKLNNTLSIIFGILLTCLGVVSGWQMTVITEQNRQIKVQNEKFDNLPEKYVRLERYAADIKDVKSSMCQIRDSLQLDIRALSADIKELGNKIVLRNSFDRRVEK